jgi:hypothetical protein
LILENQPKRDAGVGVLYPLTLQAAATGEKITFLESTMTMGQEVRFHYCWGINEGGGDLEEKAIITDGFIIWTIMNPYSSQSNASTNSSTCCLLVASHSLMPSNCASYNIWKQGQTLKAQEMQGPEEE